MAATIRFEFDNHSYLFEGKAASLTVTPLALGPFTPNFDDTADNLLRIKEQVHEASQLPVRLLSELATVVSSFVQTCEESRSKQFWSSNSKSSKVSQLKSFQQELTRRVSEREGSDRGMLAIRLREIDKPDCVQALVELTCLLLTTTDKVAKESGTESAKKVALDKWLKVLLEDVSSLYQALIQLLHLDPQFQWVKTYASKTSDEARLTACRQALKEIPYNQRTLPHFARYNLNMLLKAFDLIEQHIAQRSCMLVRVWQAALCVWDLHASLLKGFSMAAFMDTLFSTVELPKEHACRVLFAYLKETASLWRHPQAPAILERGLSELARHEDTFDWLNAVITCKLPREVMERFVVAICAIKTSSPTARVLLRYHQIMRTESADTSLFKYESLQIAYYVQHHLDRSSILCNVLSKHGHDYLPRSLQYDGNTGHVSVLLKEKTREGPPLLFETGSYKKVTGAIDLPPECTGDTIELAQAVNLDKRGKTITTPEMIRELQEEAEKHSLFYGTGQRGIWPIINRSSVYTTEKTVDSQKIKIPKMSILYLKGKTAYKLIFKEGVVLSPEQFLFIFDELTEGLYSLHVKGFIHGDITPHNILMKIVRGEILVGLSDFGQSHIPRTHKPPAHYLKGIFGTAIYTPPEMIASQNCDCNLFLAEMFAFGLALWVILKKDKFDWADFLKETPWNEIPLETLHTLIRKGAEQRRADLFKQKKRTLIEELELFALNMVRIEPNQRTTSQKAREEISAIKAKFSFKP